MTETTTEQLLVVGRIWQTGKIAIQKFCSTQGVWIVLKQLDEHRSYFGAVCVDNTIVFIGGKLNGNVTSAVSSLALDSMQHKTLASMRNERLSPAVAVFENYIYAAGGYDRKGNDLKTVERLNLNIGKWESAPDLNEVRYGAAAVVLEGCLYVIGGCVESVTEMRTVERYDGIHQAWIRCRPLLEKRRWHGAATLRGCIYVVGGWNDGKLSTAERYDPKTELWTKLCDLHNVRWEFGCLAFEHSLYAIGGEFDSSVEVYNPDTNTWTLQEAQLVHESKQMVAVMT